MGEGPTVVRIDQQLAEDRDALGGILAGLERVGELVALAEADIGATTRGYFTPDEDDRVRQILCSYRGLRIACYEIIHRWWDFDELPDRSQALQAFLVAYAAALGLYGKSLALIQAFERRALVRAKLNEPDRKFDLPPRFFEELVEAYSATGNLVALSRAHRYWINSRREIVRLEQERPDDYGSLVALIRERQPLVRKRLWSVIGSRVRHDLRAVPRLLRRPLRHTRFGLQAIVTGLAPGHGLQAPRTSALHGVLARLLEDLQPGDVLLVRGEGRLTTALIPGFWSHAAIYFGGRAELEALGLQSHAFVGRHWAHVPEAPGRGYVIEAVSPRVTVNSLEHCLAADHVAVLRPRLPPVDLAQAIGEAFGHMGKSYDFEFDFNLSSRIVCTGLVWRAFHKRGPIAFTLVKRLGRFTLTPDDIVEQILAAPGPAAAPFDVVALALHERDGGVRLRHGAEAQDALHDLLAGWRPASAQQPPPRERARA